MTSLRRFWTSFDAFVRRAVGRPYDERAFTRFVYSRRQLKDVHVAFSPPASGKLSVCQVLGRAATKLWSIGRRIRPTATLRGRIDFSGNTVPTVAPELRLVVDHVGFRGHANLEGWPRDKHAQMILAKALAGTGTVHTRPNADEGE